MLKKKNSTGEFLIQTDVSVFGIESLITPAWFKVALTGCKESQFYSSLSGKL